MCVVHFRSGVNVMPRCLCWATASIGWLSITSGVSLVFPMFSNFVFSCPNLPFQLRAHCSASFTAPWSAVVFVVAVFRVRVSWISASSAYSSVGRLTCDGRSFMKTRNRTGPRCEPWGTPAEMVCWGDRVEPTRTEIVLFVRKSAIQDTLGGATPIIASLCRRPVCQTLSNAFLKSMNTADGCLPRSNAVVQVSAT